VVRVAPQRRKVSFYGTLNLATGEEVVLRAEKLNAATTVPICSNSWRVGPRNRPCCAERVLSLLWDRAPWHSGAALREFYAAHHNHVQCDLATLADRFAQHLQEHIFASTLLDDLDYPRICARFK